MKTKICIKCRKRKYLNKFHKHKGNKDGLRNQCSRCRKIYQKKWNKTHKDHKKDYQLQLNYGITLQQFRRMLKSQHNKCALCNKNADQCSRGLGVDHNHKTGKIRGLLCANCNLWLLGKYGDNIKFYKKIIRYLGRAR